MECCPACRCLLLIAADCCCRGMPSSTPRFVRPPLRSALTRCRCRGPCLQAAANNDGQYKVSLRSLGDEDTTVVSKALGGGGHRNASSFLADVQEVESWRLLD